MNNQAFPNTFFFFSRASALSSYHAKYDAPSGAEEKKKFENPQNCNFLRMIKTSGGILDFLDVNSTFQNL